MDMTMLNAAIFIYFSVGISNYPRAVPERLSEIFGTVDAEVLLSSIQKLTNEFYATSPAPGESKGDALHRAEAAFRAMRPELSDAAVSAFSWAYSYDWK